MSCGSDQVVEYRRSATYADPILKRAKPSELPAQTLIKFALEINLKAAKAPGLTVAPPRLTRADELIELC